MHLNERLQEVEALTYASDHIQFAKKIAENIQITKTENQILLNKIDKVDNRRLDPNLYLAVIGEFNTGKSTFINALLADSLLKSSNVPMTTTSATRLRYGQTLQLSLTPRKKQKKRLQIKEIEHSQKVQFSFNSLDDFIVKASKYKRNNVKRKVESETLYEFVQQVTTKDETAQKVQGILIDHPAEFLNNGIVIIDTPGSNVTNEAHHHEILQIVENEADAAIIVIPSDKPVPRSLQLLLKDSLSTYLHRCLFVITKLDHIQDEEHEQLIEYIKEILAQELGVDSPDVYPTAAQAIVDEYLDQPVIQNSSKRSYWQEQFHVLKGFVQKRLQEERILSVSESLLRLLEDLFSQLESILQERKSEFQRRKKLLKKESIQDLNEFSQRQHNICDQKLKQLKTETLNQVARVVKAHRKTMTTYIESRIFSTDEFDELEKFINAQVETRMTADKYELEREIDKIFRRYKKKVTNIRKEFDTEFQNVYQRLNVLRSHINISSKSTTKNITATSSIVNSMKSMQSDLDFKTGGGLVGGAAAGAALGTFLFPGVGTIVGGVIGYLGGGLLLRGSINKYQNKLWDSIRPQLHTYFDDVDKYLKKEVRAIDKRTHKSLHNHIDRHVDRYSETVDELKASQKEEQKALARWEKDVNIFLTEVTKRMELVEKQQIKLKEMTYVSKQNGSK